MPQPDDLSLIRLFIQGKTALAANPNLRIQAAQEMIQLLTRRGQVIAIAKPTAVPATLILRPQSDYTQVLHKMLLAYHFMPVGQHEQTQFLTYEYHPIPAQHQLRNTTALALWKYWWTHRRRFVGPSSTDELLLFTRRRWAPVNEIACNQGTLFVQTLLGETSLQSLDEVVWVEKMEEVEAEEEKTVFFVGAAPGSTHPTTPPPAPLSVSQDRVTASVSTDRADRVPAGGHPSQPTLPILAANLRHQVTVYNGKLLIHTAAGNIVVEGHDIKCYLAPPLLASRGAERGERVEAVVSGA